MWDKAQPRTQPRAGSHAVPSPPAGPKSSQQNLEPERPGRGPPTGAGPAAELARGVLAGRGRGDKRLGLTLPPPLLSIGKSQNPVSTGGRRAREFTYVWTCLPRGAKRKRVDLEGPTKYPPHDPASPP